MTARWYVLHVYSGFEKKVATSIKEQAEQKGMKELFEQVMVPTESVVEMRNHDERRCREHDDERGLQDGETGKNARHHGDAA